MPRVKSLAQATEIAVSFLERYYAFPQPLRSDREDDMWVLDVAVSFTPRRTAKVKIDANTGEVVEYLVEAR